MDFAGIVGPAVTAAIVSGVVSLGASYFNSRAAARMHSERLTADANLAEKKFFYEKGLADWKRKTELAETVLAGFYKARGIFHAARQPFSFSNEGATRPKDESESPAETSRKNALYAPLERLNKERDFLTELTALRYRFSALFGREADKSFQDILSAYREVQIATEMLLDEDLAPGDPERKKLREAIGWSIKDDDKISLALDDAVSVIERLCKPVLMSNPSA